MPSTSTYFGESIRRWADERGMTLRAVAEAAGIPYPRLIDLVRGRVLTVSNSEILPLARVLSVPTLEIIRSAIRSGACRIPPSPFEKDWMVDAAMTVLDSTSTDVERRELKELSRGWRWDDLAARATSMVEAVYPRALSVRLEPRPFPVAELVADVIETLAEENGVPIRLETPSETEFDPEGSVVAEGEGLVISIRRDVYEDALMGDGRARFTVAHELGHAATCWRELREHSGSYVLRDTYGAPTSYPRDVRAYLCPERVANQWAACLLMPEAKVLAILRDAIDSNEPFDEAEILADTFAVSPSAASIRASKLWSSLQRGESMN